MGHLQGEHVCLAGDSWLCCLVPVYLIGRKWRWKKKSKFQRFSHPSSKCKAERQFTISTMRWAQERLRRASASTGSEALNRYESLQDTRCKD